MHYDAPMRPESTNRIIIRLMTSWLTNTIVRRFYEDEEAQSFCEMSAELAMAAVVNAKKVMKEADQTAERTSQSSAKRPELVVSFRVTEH